MNIRTHYNQIMHKTAVLVNTDICFAAKPLFIALLRLVCVRVTLFLLVLC